MLSILFQLCLYPSDLPLAAALSQITLPLHSQYQNIHTVILVLVSALCPRVQKYGIYYTEIYFSGMLDKLINHLSNIYPSNIVKFFIFSPAPVTWPQGHKQTKIHKHHNLWCHHLEKYNNLQIRHV